MSVALRSSVVGRELLLMRQGAALPRLSHPAAVRWQSTGPATTSQSPAPSPSTPPGSTPLPPPHRRSSGPPSKHKLVYRNIVPPLARVLAYASIVYFSLHLAWQYLDGREQKQLEGQVREEMEAQVRETLERKGVVESQKGERTGKGWWTWLTGK